MQEIVSIIVPVYNTDVYLGKCLTSILVQTYKKLEVILVDDGSTDNSSEICNQFVRRDNRFKAIRKTNGGNTSARKAGLKEAQGNYIAFVDSDDWLEPTFIEALMKEMLNSAVDIIASGCIKEYKNSSEISVNNISEGIYRGELLKQEVFSRMLHYNGFFKFGIQPYLWNKLYRKEVIYNCLMKLDERIYNGEDVACLFDCILSSKSIQIVNFCLYHYRNQNNSITNRADKKIFENIIYLYSYMEKYFSELSFSKDLMPQLKYYISYMISMASKRMFDIDIVVNSRGLKSFLFPFGLVKKNSKIILYAAGDVGKSFYYQIKHSGYCEIVLWVDKQYEKYSNTDYYITNPKEIRMVGYDYIVICIQDKSVSEEVRIFLLGLGVDGDKIVWSQDYQL